MADLEHGEINVKEVVTDAHPQISATMKKTYPHVRHSWDMWHGAKNLGKKLNAAAMEKGNNSLKPWVSDIVNHFFWSAETFGGDVELLQGKVATVMSQCLTVHEGALWRCEHEQIEEDAVRDKDCLEADDPAAEALERVIMDPRFQSNLHHYVTCQTTSELESFNNHLLMYVVKRCTFSYASYKCRSQLAAIDYNQHLDRSLKKNQKGENYYCRTFSKAANHWTFKHVREKKTYHYIPEMMRNILNAYCVGYKDKPLSDTRVRAADDPRNIAPTIAPTAPPPTEELVDTRISRLKKKNWSKAGTSK